MAEQNFDQSGLADFTRPGQQPATPYQSPFYGSYAPPSDYTSAAPPPGAPHSFGTAASYALPSVTPVAPTAVPRRRGRRGARVLLGLGAMAVVGALAVSTLLVPRAITSAGTGSSVPSVQSGQGTSGSGASGSSGTSGSGDSGTSGAAGTSGSSSTTSTATAAQSVGVVLITTTLTNGAAAGTGMVLESSGLVLTNYHVVQGSTSVKVEIASTKETYTAKVVGHDATNDVALLQIEGVSGLATVTVDRDSVKVSDVVTAVGNAQGQGFLSAATGTITDTDATITVSNDQGGTETLKDAYQTDAGAVPGDSGGPLYDAQDQVTGMTSAGQQTYSGPGRSSSSRPASTVASYAIPIAKALAIVQQIESGTESGTVQIGANAYLGILVSSSPSGATVVSGVTAGTAAAKAGIGAGSTLTSLGGTAVSTQSEIAAVLSGKNPGDTVKIAWTDSSGKAHGASVTLGTSPVN